VRKQFAAIALGIRQKDIFFAAVVEAVGQYGHVAELNQYL
jgi:hypothetical protein